MCINNSSCGCHLNRCRNLGPFTSVDRECISVDRDCMIPPAIRRVGFMIPYASGATSFLLFSPGAAGGFSRTVLIAFGHSSASPSLASTGTITLTGAGPNEAFQVSQAGQITAFSASFTNLGLIDLQSADASVIVNARIWKAPVGDINFKPTNASINLIQTTSDVPTNTVSSGTINVIPPVPIAVGERLLLVYSHTLTGSVSSIEGTASASITIE